MAGIKTAISLEKKLFDRVNKLATEMHISRSRIFSLAAEDYLKKVESKKMLAKINAAYGDDLTEEEIKIERTMKQKQRKNLEIETW